MVMPGLQPPRPETSAEHSRGELSEAEPRLKVALYPILWPQVKAPRVPRRGTKPKLQVGQVAREPVRLEALWGLEMKSLEGEIQAGESLQGQAARAAELLAAQEVAAVMAPGAQIQLT